MVVLTAEQVRAWDQFTMLHEPIASIDLMERAAVSCVKWLEDHRILQQQQFYIFCGKGNNGGDGLAMARLLLEKGRPVDVFILEFGLPGTDEFQHNLKLLHQLPINIHFLQPDVPLPQIPDTVIILDALLGTGTNRPAEGRMAELISQLNASPNFKISIDLPSGLSADKSIYPSLAVQANITLSFQCYKPALFFPENAPYFGQVVILDIGLLPQYLTQIQAPFDLIDQSLAAAIVQPRKAYSHKGNFGHALLAVGSHGKMGAAVLAAKAALRSGAGLLSCLIPENGLSIIQTSVPEAMAITTGTDTLAPAAIDYTKYSTIGCGPGIGTNPSAAALLEEILIAAKRPVVLDADAINLLAAEPEWLRKLPPFSILTPHPREFERLAGRSSNDEERFQKLRDLAKKYQLVMILKGHRTLIAMPGGKAYFNMSGNASMAKGGSGDVLTGILTGLMVRGYAPDQASLLGVYLHGIAGELASRNLGMESVLATDITEQIGNAFVSFSIP